VGKREVDKSKQKTEHGRNAKTEKEKERELCEVGELETQNSTPGSCSFTISSNPVATTSYPISIPATRSSSRASRMSWQSEIAAFGDASDQAAFNFLARALYDTNPAETKLGLDGPNLVGKLSFFSLPLSSVLASLCLSRSSSSTPSVSLHFYKA
jgi:hypothetical protein